MAKLRAPLFSLAASGRIGASLHYVDAPSSARVAGPMLRTDANSPAQQAQRSHFQTAVGYWNLPPEVVDEHVLWATLAATDFPRLSGYNVSLSAVMSNLAAGLPWQNILVQDIGTISGANWLFQVDGLGVRQNYFARYQLLPDGPVSMVDGWAPSPGGFRLSETKPSTPGVYRCQIQYLVAGVLHGYTGIAFVTVT